jgi:oligopeptide transport system permease protein
MTVTAFPPSLSPVEEIKGRSLWSDAWRRLLHNKAAVVSIVLLLIITLASIFGPLFSSFAYDDVSWDSISIPPDFASGHYFGTDDNGRDLFVRVMYGGRISLTVGVVATLVSLFIGVVWGATAGFMLTVVFGRNIVLIYVAIGAVSWLDMARIVRGQTMSLKKREFVEAAHAGGVRTATVIRRHIIPNCLGPVIVYVTLTVPNVILLESFLSFLGLGVQEPQTSWGVLISDGARLMESSPWALIFPAVMLAVTLGCFNFIGDGLRDALDPKDR